MSTLPIEAILIDFDEEIEYGQDQAYLSYPTVFPTVNLMLQDTPELIAVADALCSHEEEDIYEFMIGINGFTKSRLDNCIMFFIGGIPRRIELADEEQYDIFNRLDAQCREHLGKGCEDLLKEAESEIT